MRLLIAENQQANSVSFALISLPCVILMLASNFFGNFHEFLEWQHYVSKIRGLSKGQLRMKD